MNDVARCTALTKKTNTPCPNGVWRGSPIYCFLHDPGPMAQSMRLEARKEGNKTKRLKLPVQSPQSAYDAMVGLATVIGGLWEKGGKAADLIAGYKAYMDALELVELEDRITTLEEIENAKKNKQSS